MSRTRAAKMTIRARENAAAKKVTFVPAEDGAKPFLVSDDAQQLQISKDGKRLFWNRKPIVLVPRWYAVVSSIIMVFFAFTGFIASLIAIGNHFSPSQASSPALSSTQLEEPALVNPQLSSEEEPSIGRSN